MSVISFTVLTMCCVSLTTIVCDCIYIGTCPKGNDPMTTTDQYRTIVLSLGAGNVQSGDFYVFSFNGDSFSLPSTGSLWSAAECKAAFESLDGITTVDCTRATVDTADAPTGVPTTDYTIVFRKFPTLARSDSKNIYNNDGTVPLSSLACDTGPVPSSRRPYCVLSDYPLPGYPLANKTLPGKSSVVAAFIN